MGNHIRTIREVSGDCPLKKLLTVRRRWPLVIVLRKIVDRTLGTVLRWFQFGKQKWPTQEKDCPEDFTEAYLQYRRGLIGMEETVPFQQSCWKEFQGLDGCDIFCNHYVGHRIFGIFCATILYVDVFEIGEKTIFNWQSCVPSSISLDRHLPSFHWGW